MYACIYVLSTIVNKLNQFERLNFIYFLIFFSSAIKIFLKIRIQLLFCFSQELDASSFPPIGSTDDEALIHN